MIRDKRVDPDVDRLLKQAFPDDLPAEAATKMIGQIDRLREGWKQEERDDIRVSSRPRRWTPALTGVTLAAVSVLFVILGLRLRASSPPADVGSSLAALHWEAFLCNRIAEFQSMECEVRLDKPEVPSRYFIIQWISPEETRVRLGIGGKETVRTVRQSKSIKSILELSAESDQDETAAAFQLEDDLRPVEGLLSSARLRGLLEGRWEPAGIEQRDGCDWKSFSVSQAPDAPASRIAIDTCTSLPVRLEKEFDTGERIEAFFRWVPRTETRGSLLLWRLSRSAEETTS